MRYKLLGRSGLRVSELCLGTMTFGEDWGWGASKQESRAIYDAFLAAGGNFIDTANLYTNGTSENFLGEFIGSDRGHIVLATKYTNAMPGNDPNAAGNHRKSMVQAVEASLKRLKTDYIDLYWLHIWDFLTPIDEIMRAFDDLVRAGKILYAGISDAPAWVVSRANTMAELRGWSSFIGLQIEYSLIQRTPERELLPMARELDIGVTAWAPLASGVLTGKYTAEDHDQPKRLQDAKLDDRKQRIVDAVQVIAGESGYSAAQVAINWVRQQSGVVIPIIGARTLTQAQDNLDALKFSLTPEHLKRLTEASDIELGFPHDFFARDMVRGFVYGGTRDLIDNHRQ
ncbi:MAG: aldo/keto reductase [Acidobacteriota bacterium]|nr:aldo/keto reductase [Acidobacteriota bacterium]